MKLSDLHRCSIKSWYETFKSDTIKTVFIPLSDPFIRYLIGAADTDTDSVSPPPFLLPRPAVGGSPLPRTAAHLLDPVSSLSILSSDSDSDTDTDTVSASAPSFPDMESAITQAIADLGGAAFPKLNWSSPKDAAWISCDGTLCCRTFTDLILLLKSSDAVDHDLTEAIPSCSDVVTDTFHDTQFYLALRKWYPSFHPDMEFRCFVYHNRLVGISQRDVTVFYPQLQDRKHELKLLVEEFYCNVIERRFESEDYTFDVYVTRDGRVKLLDFNPWGVFTLPLLFEWEEMEAEGFGVEGVEFRVVEGQCGVRPGLKTAVPYDYLDTSAGSGWDQFFKRVDEEQKAQIGDDGRD